MVFLSSQVDVRGVRFPDELRRPAGGRGPGSQSGRGGEPLVQDAGPRRVQVAAATAAARPVLHLYGLPAEISVTQSLAELTVMNYSNNDEPTMTQNKSIGVALISQRT